MKILKNCIRCFLFFTIFTISACSINGSFQGLYSYYHKTVKIAPSLIQKPAVPVCSLIQPDTPVIYAINGKELKQCVDQFEKCIVYIWRPKCSGDICVSPASLQSFCNTNNIELFIVAEYYDYVNMTLNHPVERPIFGIDCDYYSSNLTKKYISMFISDLSGEGKISDGNYYFLFNYGCLIDMADELEGVKIQI